MIRYFVLGIVFATALTACTAQEKKTVAEPQKGIPTTETAWKEKLSPEAYEVLRQKGTEAPFSGKYWNHFEKGVYVCAGCENVLFRSDAKFDSECGWPSFDQAVKGAVIYKDDFSFGMERTEVLCAKCNGHLGHVFDDGPEKTTGKRYCTNSVSIIFKPQ